MPLYIITDRAKLMHILTNIIANAIKFTPEHKIVILYTQVMGNFMVFNVIDQGIGITSEQQTVIFEPFKQVDPTIAQEYGGLGLGLAISQKMASLLQGKITVQSALCQGAIFTLTLPLIRDTSDEHSALESVTHNTTDIVIPDDEAISPATGSYSITSLTPVTLPIAMRDRLFQAIEGNAITHIKTILTEIESYGPDEQALVNYLRNLLIHYDLPAMRQTLEIYVKT